MKVLLDSLGRDLSTLSIAVRKLEDRIAGEGRGAEVCLQGSESPVKGSRLIFSGGVVA